MSSHLFPCSGILAQDALVSSRPVPPATAAFPTQTQAHGPGLWPPSHHSSPSTRSKGRAGWCVRCPHAGTGHRHRGALRLNGGHLSSPSGTFASMQPKPSFSLQAIRCYSACARWFAKQTLQHCCKDTNITITFPEIIIFFPWWD